MLSGALEAGGPFLPPASSPKFQKALACLPICLHASRTPSLLPHQAHGKAVCACCRRAAAPTCDSPTNCSSGLHGKPSARLAPAVPGALGQGTFRGCLRKRNTIPPCGEAEPVLWGLAAIGEARAVAMRRDAEQHPAPAASNCRLSTLDRHSCHLLAWLSERLPAYGWTSPREDRELW